MKQVGNKRGEPSIQLIAMLIDTNWDTKLKVTQSA